MNLPFPTNHNPTKYKTMLCKHFSSSKGCSFGTECQFAHGTKDLRNPTTGNTMMFMNQNPLMTTAQTTVKKGPNAQNYKIVKCKYFEKEGMCRYGSLCTFAHGDAELRKKSDNVDISSTTTQAVNAMFPQDITTQQNMMNMMALQNMMMMMNQQQQPLGMEAIQNGGGGMILGGMNMGNE